MKFLALTLTAAMFAGSFAFASESVDEKPVKRYRPAPQVQQQQQPNDDYQDYDQNYQGEGYAQGGYAQGGCGGGYCGQGPQAGCCGQVPVQQPCCGAYPPPVLPIVPLPQPVAREICWVVVNPYNWGIMSSIRGTVASGSNWQRGRIAYMRQVLIAQGCVFTN